ncbi:MAG: hypothetical protein H6739_25105 [Alphaproteobacteria bacterium]|nr:hypothetical protein [Alphaproteobacteria bacterium]
MIYESITLRPAHGRFNADEVVAWLASQPHVLLDEPGAQWVLCLNVRGVHATTESYERDPACARGDLCVTVQDWGLWIGGITSREQDARGLEFLRAIHPEGGWRVHADGQDLGLVSDPAALFPDDLPDPTTFTDDMTLLPVLSGERAFLTFGADAAVYLVVHSEGQWCLVTPDRELRGELTPPCAEAWREATALVDEDDLALPADLTPPETLLRVDLELPDGRWDEERSLLYQQSTPPPSARDVTALGLRLRDALLGWSKGAKVEGVAWVEEVGRPQR